MSNLTAIKSIKLPTNDEINAMSIEEVKEWRDKLQEFYEQRAEILNEYGYFEYRKAHQYRTFLYMVKNLEAGEPRWKRISSNYD